MVENEIKQTTKISNNKNNRKSNFKVPNSNNLKKKKKKKDKSVSFISFSVSRWFS